MDGMAFSFTMLEISPEREFFYFKNKKWTDFGMFSTLKNEELIGIIRFVYLVKVCSQKYRSYCQFYPVFSGYLFEVVGIQYFAILQ